MCNYIFERGKIVPINYENDFMMNLISENIDLLLQYTEYSYNTNYKIKYVLLNRPEGFIAINYDDMKQKYYISHIFRCA